MARTSREIMAAGFEEIDTRLTNIDHKLDQVITVLRDLADGLSEHRQHTIQSVSDIGAEVRQLRTSVQQLQQRASNGGE